METDCKWCGSKRVVPVLDKRIERSPKTGNKFRVYCLACDRWMPFTSDKEYRDHLHPHVLPADADPEADDPTVPLEDYDYGPEWRDLAERTARSRPEQQAATDGGEVVEEDDEADAVDGDEPEPVNRFDCPGAGCEAVVEGEPDECPACGVGYDWSDTK